MTIKLGETQIADALQELEHWELRDDKLYRKFQFKDFVAAFGFMTQAAIQAERINHHPEWSNVYNSVEVYLTTHEVSGLTMRDITLANIMDEIAQQLLK